MNTYKKERNDDDLVFIYNPEMKNYFKSKGVRLYDSDTHKKTHKQYWVYKYGDVKSEMKVWNERSHSN